MVSENQDKASNNQIRASLTNTKWICEIADNCVNIYDFKEDSSYLFYSCEMEDSLFGHYYFKGDTLILNEQGSIYDEEYPEGSVHRSGRKIYWISFNGNKFKHLKMSELINDRFVISDFKFDDNLYYTKVSNN